MRGKQRQLILFVLTLGTILAGMYPLLLVPSLYNYGGEFNQATGQVLLKVKRTVQSRSEHHQWLDPETGKIHADAPPPLKPGIGTVTHIDVDSKMHFECSAIIRNAEGDLAWVEFDFPRADYGTSYPVLIAERFAVAIEEQKLLYLDLHDPTGDLQEFPLAGVQPKNGSFLEVLSEGERFLVTEYPTNTRKRYASLFEMTSSGPRELAVLPAPIYWDIQGEFLYITDPQESFQRFSIVDGQHLQEFQFSDVVEERRQDSTFRDMHLAGSLLAMSFTTENGNNFQEYYDLNTQELVLEIEGLWYPVRRGIFGSPPGQPLMLYRGNGQVEKLAGFDPVKNRVLWTKDFEVEPLIFGRSGDHLVLGDPTFGISVELIDQWTGKTIQQHRPLLFVTWLLPLVMLALAIWIVAWLQFSSAFLPAWLNVSWLAGMVLGLLLLYLFYWGFLPSTPYLPLMNYMHGILLGLTIGAGSWLVLGRSHTWLRYLPALGVLCLLVVVSRLIFSGQQSFAAGAFVSTIVPACLAMLPVAALRWFRFRWEPKSTHSDRTETQARSMNIRDLFIAAAGTAAILGALRPVLSSLALPDFNTSVIVASICTISSTFLLIAATQSPSRKLSIFSFILAALLLATLLFEFLYPFVTSNSFMAERMSHPQVLLRVVTTSQLTFFFLLLAYRFQDWRLVRRVK